MPKRSDIRITRTTVEAWRREALRDERERIVFDRECAGFGVRVKSNGFTYFFVQYRKAGKTRRHAIGPFSADPAVPFSVDQARGEAQRERIKVRQDPDYDPAQDRKRRVAESVAGKDTLRAIGAKYIERVAKKRNRSWAETERILERYVYPTLGDRRIHKITRLNVTELLDTVEDREIADGKKRLGGPVMADRVLAAVRRIFNWHASRDGTFNTPIVKGMARTKPAERARKRVLTAAELRAVWLACDVAEPAVFGAMVKMLLLTAQRRDEVAKMRWTEIEGDLWTIPADRYKTKRENVVPLSRAAVAVLAGLTKNGDFVFTAGKTTSRPAKYDDETPRPFGNISAAKADLEADSGTSGWTLHDLRRTAKTLMQAGGVRPDISERVLGHVIAGVEGTYDQHGYLEEKRAALEVLAQQIDRIVKPPVQDSAEPVQPAQGA